MWHKVALLCNLEDDEGSLHKRHFEPQVTAFLRTKGIHLRDTPQEAVGTMIGE